MDCYSFEKLISDYLDSNLKAKDLLAAEEHLAQCPDCAARISDIKKILKALHSLPACSLSHGFEARLLACIEEQKKKKETSFINLFHQYSRSFAVAAAVFLLLASSLFVYTSYTRTRGMSRIPSADAPALKAMPGKTPSSDFSSEENASIDSSKTLPLNYQRHIKVVNE